MDLTYRTELRELNDLNFGRFDAKVGERLAELRAQLSSIDQRFEKVDQRFEKVDRRFEKVDERLDLLSKEIHDTKTSLVRWMFALWVGTALAVAGSRLVL